MFENTTLLFSLIFYVHVDKSVFFSKCIFRDPRCTVILDGKEISLLHARVVQFDQNIKLETLTRTHKVKVNGSLIYYGSDSLLQENDVVEIGKETFTWNSKNKNTIHALTY